MKREEIELAFNLLNKKDKKKKKKMRGKGKIGREMENKSHNMMEAIREKNKIQFQKDYKKQKEEDEILARDMQFLDKVEFDPLEGKMNKR